MKIREISLHIVPLLACVGATVLLWKFAGLPLWFSIVAVAVISIIATLRVR